MNYFNRNLLLVLLAISLPACVTTNASRLATSTESRPIILPQNVALYRVASQVPRRYEEVALLNSAGDSNFTNEAKMFESMKKAAGKLGANAVILDALSEPSGGAKVAAAIFGVSAQRKGKALAIWIFPNDEPLPQQQEFSLPRPAITQQAMPVPATVVGASSFSGEAAPVAKNELEKLHCFDNFNLVSESQGRSIYEASCISGKRQLVECLSGVCKALN